MTNNAQNLLNELFDVCRQELTCTTIADQFAARRRYLDERVLARVAAMGVQGRSPFLGAATAVIPRGWMVGGARRGMLVALELALRGQCVLQCCDIARPCRCACLLEPLLACMLWQCHAFGAPVQLCQGVERKTPEPYTQEDYDVPKMGMAGGGCWLRCVKPRYRPVFGAVFGAGAAWQAVRWCFENASDLMVPDVAHLVAISLRDGGGPHIDACPPIGHMKVRRQRRMFYQCLVEGKTGPGRAFVMWEHELGNVVEILQDANSWEIRRTMDWAWATECGDVLMSGSGMAQGLEPHHQHGGRRRASSQSSSGSTRSGGSRYSARLEDDEIPPNMRGLAVCDRDYLADVEGWAQALRTLEEVGVLGQEDGLRAAYMKVAVLRRFSVHDWMKYSGWVYGGMRKEQRFLFAKHMYANAHSPDDTLTLATAWVVGGTTSRVLDSVWVQGMPECPRRSKPITKRFPLFAKRHGWNVCDACLMPCRVGQHTTRCNACPGAGQQTSVTVMLNVFQREGALAIQDIGTETVSVEPGFRQLMTGSAVYELSSGPSVEALPSPGSASHPILRVNTFQSAVVDSPVEGTMQWIAEGQIIEQLRSGGPIRRAVMAIAKEAHDAATPLFTMGGIPRALLCLVERLTEDGQWAMGTIEQLTPHVLSSLAIGRIDKKVKVALEAAGLEAGEPVMSYAAPVTTGDPAAAMVYLRGATGSGTLDIFHAVACIEVVLDLALSKTEANTRGLDDLNQVVSNLGGLRLLTEKLGEDLERTNGVLRGQAVAGEGLTGQLLEHEGVMQEMAERMERYRAELQQNLVSHDYFEVSRRDCAATAEKLDQCLQITNAMRAEMSTYSIELQKLQAATSSGSSSASELADSARQLVLAGGLPREWEHQVREMCAGGPKLSLGPQTQEEIADLVDYLQGQAVAHQANDGEPKAYRAMEVLTDQVGELASGLMLVRDAHEATAEVCLAQLPEIARIIGELGERVCCMETAQYRVTAEREDDQAAADDSAAFRLARRDSALRPITERAPHVRRRSRVRVTVDDTYLAQVALQQVEPRLQELEADRVAAIEQVKELNEEVRRLRAEGKTRDVAYEQLWHSVQATMGTAQVCSGCSELTSDIGRTAERLGLLEEEQVHLETTMAQMQGARERDTEAVGRCLALAEDLHQQKQIVADLLIKVDAGVGSPNSCTGCASAHAKADGAALKAEEARASAMSCSDRLEDAKAQWQSELKRTAARMPSTDDVVASLNMEALRGPQGPAGAPATVQDVLAQIDLGALRGADGRDGKDANPTEWLTWREGTAEELDGYAVRLDTTQKPFCLLVQRGASPQMAPIGTDNAMLRVVAANSMQAYERKYGRAMPGIGTLLFQDDAAGDALLNALRNDAESFAWLQAQYPNVPARVYGRKRDWARHMRAMLPTLGGLDAFCHKVVERYGSEIILTHGLGIDPAVVACSSSDANVADHNISDR